MTAKLIVLRRHPEQPEVPDEALVEAMAHGDRDALGTLYDRHHALVWRFVARTLGPRGPEAADVVQSTFLEAWKSAPRFAGRSSARSWLLGIANNLVRRHIRDGTRRRAALTLLAAESTGPAVTDGNLDTRLMLERMQEALQSLSPPLRTAFVLCDLEEIRGVEAAKILGVRPGTLWRRLHDARKRLRRALEGESP